MEHESTHETFERTALPHLDSLYGAALRYTRDPSRAEDLVQDTVVRAFRFWSSFKPGTSIRAWLFTILRNTFINGYHRTNRRTGFRRQVKGDMRSLGPALAIGDTSASRADADTALDQASTRARIDAALESLPEDYRVAVTLADIDGLSYKEIAEVMECPIGTVMSRIYRGRKRLHKLLFDHAAELGYVAADRDPDHRPSTRRRPGGGSTADERPTEGSAPAIQLDDYRKRGNA